MKIYTKTGDSGYTGLFGGDRVPKHALRIEAYGTVDEANSLLGLARIHAAPDANLADLERILHKIQSELFVLGADLATPLPSKANVPRIQEAHISSVENEIDQFQSELPELKHFVLPGGSLTAAALHVARTVCRRAERVTTALREKEEINPETAVYLNRLSDLLFVLARWANIKEGVDERTWRPE